MTVLRHIMLRFIRIVGVLLAALGFEWMTFGYVGISIDRDGDPAQTMRLTILLFGGGALAISGALIVYAVDRHAASKNGYQKPV
jgi:hypothetical protein